MKRRNPIARAVRTPQYRARVERDRRAEQKRGYFKHRNKEMS